MDAYVCSVVLKSGEAVSLAQSCVPVSVCVSERERARERERESVCEREGNTAPEWMK